ncbi:MAG TPA: hypothetical protein VMV20_06480, partial [Chitinophagaceae bacterium]|nr:hypothetical protein [Chitinophagaceae bacterium]
QMHTATCSFRDQIDWLRNHPSIFLWLYGSDKWPRPALESQYLDILSADDPTRPYAQSAAEHTSQITGTSGMKMRGPYDYVPPDYWYIDHKHGGAFGFNTETSPGPEVPVKESLERMIPADSLWPISQPWLFHAARGQFHNLKYYDLAMDHRLGAPTGLDDYLRKAQYLNYEGMRAMYEAFEANRFKATGIIQWMYNASWPKLWWQLYDFYLVPTAAFYGARKACEPVHIAYDYGTHGVVVDNNTLEDYQGLKAHIRVLDFNLTPLDSADIAVEDLRPQQTLTLPFSDSAISAVTYFIELGLTDGKGKEISHNFYALSHVPDVLDSTRNTWFVTPEKSYSDLTALQGLPTVHLDVEKQIQRRGDKVFASVTLRNPTNHLAFMVCVDLLRQGDHQLVTPIFWDNNYISLLPGEERTITGYCGEADLHGQTPEIRISGWNISNAR